jgi:hypothetical protein
MKIRVLWVLVAGGLGAAGYFVVSRLMNPDIVEAAPLSEEVMYLCRETGALVRGPREPGPEGIDAGDCPTLVQALYCPQCRSWYPFPPPEALARMPMGPVCPKHRTGLYEDIPEAEIESASTPQAGLSDRPLSSAEK